jgi:hypothetical protein
MRPLGPALRPEKRVEKQNPLTGFNAKTRPTKIHKPWFVGHVGLLQFVWPDAVGRAISFDGFDPKDELGFIAGENYVTNISIRVTPFI